MTVAMVDSMGDTYAIADLTGIYGWTVGSGSGASNSIITGALGGKALRLNDAKIATRTMWASDDEVTAHCRMRVSGTSTATIILAVREGATEHVNLYYDIASDVLRIRRGTTVLASTSALGWSLNQWHHVAMYAKIDDSTGAIQLWVDGVEAIALTTSLDTKNGGSTGIIDVISVQAASGQTGVDIDDLIVMTGLDYLGEKRVIGQVCESDGADTDFTPSSGSDNYAMVDDATPDGDATYNYSPTDGARDSFVFPSLGVGASAEVDVVVVHAIARKDDTSTVELATSVRIDGTDYDGTQTALSGSYGLVRSVRTVDPDTTAAWTVAGVEGAEYGYVVNVP